MNLVIDIPTEKNKFPIAFDQLISGKIYQADNDTFVFVGRSQLDHNNPINIANGMGGYSNINRFRFPIKGTTLHLGF